MEDKNSILAEIDTEQIEASYVQKFSANVIDGILELGLMIGFYFLAPQDFVINLLNAGPYIKYVIVLALIIAYRLLCITMTGKTIGMVICKTKFLNSSLLPLSAKERLIAVILPGKVSGTNYYKV